MHAHAVSNTACTSTRRVCHRARGWDCACWPRTWAPAPLLRKLQVQGAPRSDGHVPERPKRQRSLDCSSLVRGQSDVQGGARAPVHAGLHVRSPGSTGTASCWPCRSLAHHLPDDLDDQPTQDPPCVMRPLDQEAPARVPPSFSYADVRRADERSYIIRSARTEDTWTADGRRRWTERAVSTAQSNTS